MYCFNTAPIVFGTDVAICSVVMFLSWPEEFDYIKTVHRKDYLIEAAIHYLPVLHLQCSCHGRNLMKQ